MKHEESVVKMICIKEYSYDFMTDTKINIDIGEIIECVIFTEIYTESANRVIMNFKYKHFIWTTYSEDVYNYFMELSKYRELRINDILK